MKRIDQTLANTLPALTEVVEEGMVRSDHLGAQCYVSRAGRPVASGGWGRAGEDTPMTRDILSLWLSVTKPITAAAALQLYEQGRFELDDPVFTYIPEFAAHGKEGVTLRHLLTHTGGFRTADVGWRPRSWEDTLNMICQTRLEPRWEPGAKAGYHVDSAWYLLGEIVRRLDGRDFGTYVRQEIFLPLGMVDSWIGIPEESFARYAARLGHVYDCSKESPREQLLFSSPRVCALCRPGGNGRGPARELARFYEMLLGGGQWNGVRLLREDTVELMTRRHREEMFDHTFQHIMDWGLGVALDSKKYGADTLPYGYGPHCSEQTFGHSGNQTGVGFCDPAHDLVVVLIFNGMPGEERHQLRMRAALDALYRDLDLV